jgi:ABC-type glycerol-3-phosphate transport system substrate-binding protein
MNPNLQFKVVPMPQLDSERKAFASFWAEGVSEKSTKKEAAWKFIKYLSSAEVQKKLHADQSEVRPFGEMYSRKDLANEVATDPVQAAFLQDAPFAEGGYMSSYTHDDGLNDQIIKYYEDAVTALVQGQDIDEVLITLDQGVKQTLRQYGVDTSGSTN